ncbi:MAG: hypothetical protein HY871_07940 [Chloroflexi bacterium]|nr:hypothetical protein [Chloroflexota bacterium]
MDTADVLEILAIELLGIVPEDDSIVASTNRGEPVALNGKTRAGMAFQNIARRLLGDEVPFPEFNNASGLLGRLWGFVRSRPIDFKARN